MGQSSSKTATGAAAEQTPAAASGNPRPRSPVLPPQPDSPISPIDHYYPHGSSQPPKTGPDVHEPGGVVRAREGLNIACLTDGGSSTIAQSPSISYAQPQLQEPEYSECGRTATGTPVFEVQAVRERRSLRIICPLLNGVLKQSSLKSPSSPQRDEPFPPTATIFEPYEWLFHHRRRISEAAREDVRGPTSSHVRLLLDFIKKERPSSWEKLDELDSGKCKEISFEDIWLLYPTGTTVFTRDHGTWRAYKVERVEPSCHANPNKILIHCLYLDLEMTGEWLTPKCETLVVPYYSSDIPIGDLKVVPEWYFQGLKGFQRKLIERGEKFWEYSREVTYKEYHGQAWPQSSRQYPVKIIIDYRTSSKHTGMVGDTPTIIRGSSRCSACLGEALGLFSYPFNSPHVSDVCMRIPHVGIQEKEGCNPFLFCPPAMWAFSFKHKSWELISPDDIGEVKRQDGAFDQVEMEEDNKEYLESTVLTRLVGEPRRGSGPIILLHGNPGTGKTFTAECLAAKHAIPLYKITCANLGTDPEVLEKRLQEILLRAANWKALLLLDQADIFIQGRDVQDWRRSTLVSVFLHHLDTSEALLFITANCIDNIDRSLEPRITLPIHLPDIKFKGQKSIWKRCIMRLENLTRKQKEELERFIDYDLEQAEEGVYTTMNGLQIQSCITAALMLARKGNESLNIKHIRKMLKLGREFRESLQQASDSPRERYAHFVRNARRLNP